MTISGKKTLMVILYILAFGCIIFALPGIPLFIENLLNIVSPKPGGPSPYYSLGVVGAFLTSIGTGILLLLLVKKIKRSGRQIPPEQDILDAE